MRNVFLIASFCLIGVVAASAKPPKISDSAFAPSTRPVGPAVSREATDLSLDLKGATGELATWLTPFDLPVKKFNYTLQLLEDNDDTRVYRLQYPSPFQSPFAQNNVVPCEYYISRLPPGVKGPAVIVLDILDGRAIIARSLSRSLAAHGVGALYVPMAYYGSRRPADKTRMEFFSTDPARSVDALRQTVMDIRRGKAILYSREEVDPRQVGITGVSLGGIMTVLAAGVDGEFARIMPVLSGGDIASLVFHTRETRGLARKLQDAGIDRDGLAQILAPVEPLHFASRIDPHRCLMVNGKNDQVIPRESTELLVKAIGGPMIFWLPTDHYGAILYLPDIEQTAANFLGGKKVDHLGF